VRVMERAAAPRTPVRVVMLSPTPPESCKTCASDVPF
jgi:hypothetical protein